MPIRATSRHEFLEGYTFPTEPARDFECRGIPAIYASGHPKEWDQMPAAINFSADDKGGDQSTHNSYHSALSSDRKLLAISTRAGNILIYNVATKELRQVLEGAGHLAFKPSKQEGKRTKISAESAYREGYMLVSSISDSTSRGGPETNQLILWDLDQHGRVLDEEEPIKPDKFATRAIEAIAEELSAKHEWTRDFINQSTLHADFEKALRQVAADHRRRHNTVFKDAHLGHFGSVPFSSDGKLFLYHAQNGTTQHGMRDPDALPKVIVYDVDEGKELLRLSGHTDAIMWSGISPNNEYVGSISWDGTLRMYRTSNGELLWVTEDSGGQSWSGAFSSDSNHIVWSSKSGRTVQVHDVYDGRLLSTFQEKFNNWCRNLTWHPNKKEIALCVGKHAYVWDVFDGPHGSVLQHLSIDEDERRRHMADVQRVVWMDGGRLLGLETSEGSKLVYDVASNAKELFKRSTGVYTAWVDCGFYGLIQTSQDGEFYLSVDGDGKVRYWRESVAASPSWWEKEPSTIKISGKKQFPETGKYVKITKNTEKTMQHTDVGRNIWAEKGAQIWTAE